MGLGIFVQNKLRPKKDLFVEESGEDSILRKKEYADNDKDEILVFKNKQSLL